MKGGIDLSEKITYSYYTGAQASQTAFYRLSRALYEKEYFKGLSNDAKTLYALMLDRMSLSLANDWLDEEGRVYINYSLESIMESLGCGKTKAVALLKELDAETGIGLIEKKNMGIDRATVFYVKNFMLEVEETGYTVTDKCDEAFAGEQDKCAAVDNSTSRVQKTNSQEDIEYDCLGKNTTKVHNIKSYLLTSLFNAGSTISGYYKAEVNHDMPQYVG